MSSGCGAYGPRFQVAQSECLGACAIGVTTAAWGWCAPPTRRRWTARRQWDCWPALTTGGSHSVSIHFPRSVRSITWWTTGGLSSEPRRPGQFPLRRDPLMASWSLTKPIRIDAWGRAGWSVVVTGRARTVTDPDQVSRYQQLFQPWVDHADTVVAIEPEIVTGRRVIRPAVVNQ